MSDILPSPSAFTGAEASPIDLATAAAWTAADRELNPGKVRGYFFGRDIIDKILKQPGCMGLRVYYATDPATGTRHLLMVGAEANLNDQLPLALTEGAAALAVDPTEAVEYIIAEMAVPCPSGCGSPNELNGYVGR